MNNFSRSQPQQNQNYARFSTISEVERQINSGVSQESFEVKAKIAYLNLKEESKLFYPSCPDKNCLKKATQISACKKINLFILDI